MNRAKGSAFHFSGWTFMRHELTARSKSRTNFLSTVLQLAREKVVAARFVRSRFQDPASNGFTDPYQK